MVLTALDFWQDHYVAALQGSLPGAINQAVAQHLPLLQHLANAVVAGTQLPLDTAVAATADARDLPEEVRVVGGAAAPAPARRACRPACRCGAFTGATRRPLSAGGIPPVSPPMTAARPPPPQVRRELASLLRDVTGLVGLEPMLQQMAAMVQEAVATHQQRVAAPGSPSGSAAVWVALENLMYTANVVMGERACPARLALPALPCLPLQRLPLPGCRRCTAACRPALSCRRRRRRRPARRCRRQQG